MYVKPVDCNGKLRGKLWVSCNFMDDRKRVASDDARVNANNSNSCLYPGGISVIAP